MIQAKMSAVGVLMAAATIAVASAAVQTVPAEIPQTLPPGLQIPSDLPRTLPPGFEPPPPPLTDSAAPVGVRVVETAPASFAARSVSSSQSRIGFSLGVRESYGTDPAGMQSSGRSFELFSSLTPRLFGLVRRRYSDLSFDYSASYNRYDRRLRDSQSISHNASLSLARRISTRASLRLANTFSSAVNDYGTSAPNPLAITEAGFTQPLDVERQRITQNSVSASLDLRPGARSHVGISGRYDYRLFENAEIGDTQSVEVALQGDYQVNRWLFLANSYTTQLINTSAEQSRRSNIQRLQLGGLELRSRNGLVFSMGGGVEGARPQEGGYQFTGSGRVRLSKTSQLTGLSMEYRRGYSTTAHSSEILIADNVTLALNRWVSRRVNFSMNGSYMRGESLEGNRTETISGGATMGVAIHSHLLLSSTYSYVSQQAPSSLIVPSRDRYTVGVSLEYFLPSLLGR